MNKQDKVILALALIITTTAFFVYLYYYPSPYLPWLPHASWQEIAYMPEMLAIYGLGGLTFVLAVLPKKSKSHKSKSHRKKELN